MLIIGIRCFLCNRSGPIAEKTSDANDQHYEVPPAFFQLVLGKHMKYSCSQFNSKSDDLDQAEENMLQLYLDRAGIQANQNILGCFDLPECQLDLNIVATYFLQLGLNHLT